MPRAKPAAEGTPAASSMPTSVRVAVIVMALLSSLLLLTAALLGIGFDAAVDGVVRATEMSQAKARQFVLTSLLANLAIGLMLVLAAFFLPRRQPWSRWIGLAALSMLAVWILFEAVGAGGVTLITLLSLVLSSAAIASLAARTTTAWVPRQSGRD